MSNYPSHIDINIYKGIINALNYEVYVEYRKGIYLSVHMGESKPRSIEILTGFIADEFLKYNKKYAESVN